MADAATLALDHTTLGVSDVRTAHDFYTSVFSSAPVAELAADLGIESAAPGSRGAVMAVIFAQPSEVTAVLESSVRGGARVLKPAKKGFFGGFSAVFEAPDGTIWKLAAPSKKDTGPATNPPAPTETACYLGVADPNASKEFYVALGMTTDRDYGSKWIDFVTSPGECRLGLMTHAALAKDVGLDGASAGSGSLVLTRTTSSSAEVDELLATAGASGGSVVSAAIATERGGYSGLFADPDGHVWKVACV